jgi:cobalt-zinc-cadmium resistance protein CzcA
MSSRIYRMNNGRLKRVKMVAIFLLLMSLNLPVPAQERTGLPLSLDEAVAIALNNNPGIQNEGLQVTKSEILKTGAWDFSPLQFTYQYGQMYSPEFRVSAYPYTPI